MYNKLLGIMREQGKTQAEVADAIGIGKATFNKKLKGHTDFSLENIKKLCSYLSIDKESVGEVFLIK